VLQIVGLDAAVVCQVQLGSRNVYRLIPRLAFEFFQDVVLSLLFMFGIRCYGLNAR
jgi:hypothetical protein